MKQLINIVVAVMFVAGCGPSTQITASWKDTDALNPENINTILVTALTDRTTARQAVETT